MKRGYENGEESGSKVHRGNESAHEADSTGSRSATGFQPKTGSSLPGGPGSEVVPTIIRNPRIDKVTLHFKKKFQLYTGAYQFEVFTNRGLFASESQRETILLGPANKSLVTGIACLNPDLLSLYLSPIEYTNLPHWAYATKVGIKVTPLGYRLPFATNEATSVYANSQTIVQIASGVGLNTQMAVLEAEVNIIKTAPTDIVTLKGGSDTITFNNIFYGNDSATGVSGLGACLGIPMTWPIYTTLPIFDRDDANLSTNMPMLTNFLSIQNINDKKGVPVIDYQYSTKNGLLKWKEDAFQRRHMSDSTAGFTHYLNAGFNHSKPVYLQSSPLTDVYTTHTPQQVRHATEELLKPTYDFRLEKSHWLVRNNGQNITASRPPLLHFGVLPVQSNPVMDTTPEYAACGGLWEVETFMDVTLQFDFMQAGCYVLNNKGFDPVATIIHNNQHLFRTPQLYINNQFVVRSTDTVI